MKIKRTGKTDQTSNRDGPIQVCVYVQRWHKKDTYIYSLLRHFWKPKSIGCFLKTSNQLEGFGRNQNTDVFWNSPVIILIFGSSLSIGKCWPKNKENMNIIFSFIWLSRSTENLAYICCCTSTVEDSIYLFEKRN